MQQRFRNLFLEITIKGALVRILGWERVGLLRHCSYLFVIVWCAASYIVKNFCHYFLSLLNECGFITDTGRSMNCSINSVFDFPHLFCCLLRQCPESIPVPRGGQPLLYK